jgi:hypothetical protein
VVSANQIDLTWSPAEGAANYIVKRSSTGGGPYVALAPSVTTTNFSDTGLVGSKTYYYVIAAANDGGTTNSTQVSATTPPQVSVIPGAGQLQLHWPATHTGWRLEAQTNSLGAGLGTNWVTVAGSATTNQMTIPTDAENGTAFFRLVYP